MSNGTACICNDTLSSDQSDQESETNCTMQFTSLTAALHPDTLGHVLSLCICMTEDQDAAEPLCTIRMQAHQSLAEKGLTEPGRAEQDRAGQCKAGHNMAGHLVRQLYISLEGQQKGNACQSALQVPIEPPTGCHMQRGLPILHSTQNRNFIRIFSARYRIVKILLVLFQCCNENCQHHRLCNSRRCT